jgi:hypothetical protein
MSIEFNELRLLVSKTYFSTNITKAHADTLSPHELFNVVKSEKFAKLAKDNRPVISQSLENSRPLQQNLEYLNWSGFQPIDLDIKNAAIAPLVKQILEKLLYKYSWVHSIALSTSKNGLHIYTYTKPLALPDNTEMSASIQREYYLDTFEYKLMVVWKACMIVYDALIRLGVDKKDAEYAHPILNKTHTTKDLIDTTSARISQLIIITADSSISINENFVFDELMLPEILTIYQNVDDKYKINYLRDAFNSIRNRSNATIVDGVVQYNENHEFDDSFKDSIIFNEETFEQLYDKCKPLHHDNVKRYRLAYTLAYLFDLKEHGTTKYTQVEHIFLKICSGNPKFNREHKQWSNALKSAVDRNIAGNCPCIWSSVQELKNIHKFDIEVSIDDNKAIQQITDNNTDDKLEYFIKTPVDYLDYFKHTYTHEFALATDEYIGTYASQIEDALQYGTNLLIAPPGYGKTEFIKTLSAKHRVLLVEPYTSIISSKIEHSDLGFACFYGDRPLKMNGVVNVCMTFDKFTKIDIDEVSMLFDYVAIDESHLLCMSSYRGTVTADVIDKINALKTKVILMTGTNLAEHLFMKVKSSIHCYRPKDFRNKQLNFVVCQSNGDKLAKIAMHIASSLNNGKKVLFPTNKGNEYLERIVASAKSFYGKSINAKYYKKDNQLADFVDSINSAGSIGEVEVLFCSNYLSVGVDINDTCKFDIIYDEQFTAQEIEQFNCRLRKLNIESYYYFSKTDSSGMPKNITLYEDLSLELTQDENLNFNDIKNLHMNGDDSDLALFDFFKYAFSMPYFIKDPVSKKVHIHETCFRVHKFEEKWRAWAIQLNVVSTFLQKYNYNINVVSNAIESDDNIDLAIASAKEAGRLYREQRNNLTQQLLKLANDDIAFEFVCNCDYSDIIDSDKFQIVKHKQKLKLLNGDTTIFNTWRRIFRVLSRYYTRKTIFEIIDNYCFDGDSYNISSSNRLIDALRVIKNTEDENLTESNLYIVDFIISKVFDSDCKRNVYIDKIKLQQICIHIASTYIKHSASFAESLQFKMKIEQLSFRIFKALTVKTDKDVYKLIELPPFDSIDALQRHKVMNVIMSLFGEHVDIVKAQVSKNDLSSLLANNIKKIMSHDVLNDSSESIHSIIPISNETMTKQSLEYNLLEHVREIDLTDYKFKSVIETIDSQTIENFEQLDNINTILNESFIDEQLNSILDDLMSD